MAMGLIDRFVDAIVIFATDLLTPFMLIMFVFGIVMRGLVYFTVSRELWFAREFEKRAHIFIDKVGKGPQSFYVSTKRLLEKTYYEMFVVRAIMSRRKPDSVRSFYDRIFLIQHGCARVVRDTLKLIRNLRYENHQQPQFVDVSKNVFENNPCFSRVFGIFPTSGFNEFLNMLPGLFIVGGIFGTFLGIMKALPDLSGMDLSDVEGTKTTMDAFLLKVSFAMSTSIIGIICSVIQSVLNTSLSPERAFVSCVNKFESSLLSIWQVCSNNDRPENLADFDEHKDSLEALAAEAVDKENARKVFGAKQQES